MLFGQITRLAEARFKQTGRRLGFRVALAAVAALAFVVFLFFGLAGLAVWMTHSMRLQDALLVIAAGALVIVVGILVALSLEAASTAGWRRSARRSTASSSAPRRSPRCRAGCRRAR